MTVFHVALIALGCTLLSVSMTYLATVYKLRGEFMTKTEWSTLHTACNNEMCKKLDQGIAETKTVQKELKQGTNEFKVIQLFLAEVAEHLNIPPEKIKAIRDIVVEDKGRS